MEKHSFIIDTNEYAGNFEREMCAYVTGQIGECGVGSEYVEKGIPEQFENIINMPDDNGCYRPVTCFPLKGTRDNSAVAIFFDSNNPPSKEQIELMKERSNLFGENHKDWQGKPKPISVTGFRMVSFKTTQDEIEI